MPRVSDIGLQTSVLKDWGKTTGDYAKLSKEITSGTLAQSYEDLPDQAGLVLHLHSTKSMIDNGLTESKSVDLKLSKIESSLDSICDLAGQAKRMFVKAVDSGLQDPAFRRNCANMLGQVANLLNTKSIDGTYPFGNDADNRLPVNIEDLPNPGLGAGPNMAYYKGGNTISTFRADEGTPEIERSIGANEASLEKLIRALKIGATTAPDGNPDSEASQKLRQGLDLLNQANGKTGIPALLERVGDARASIDLTKDILTESKSIVEENIQEFEHTQIIEAMMRLGALKMHLVSSEKAISALLQREGLLPFMK